MAPFVMKSRRASVEVEEPHGLALALEWSRLLGDRLLECRAERRFAPLSALRRLGFAAAGTRCRARKTMTIVSVHSPSGRADAGVSALAPAAAAGRGVALQRATVHLPAQRYLDTAFEYRGVAVANSRDIDRLARTIGDATRLRMLALLTLDRQLTAKELAYGSGVKPATASVHLQRLVDEGLVRSRLQGRQKYFSLSSGEVAQLVAQIIGLARPYAPPRPAVARR
jgi:DNA-binding transcriptional ArsR family regulator